MDTGCAVVYGASLFLLVLSSMIFSVVPPLWLNFLFGVLASLFLVVACLWGALTYLGKLVGHMHLTLDPQTFRLRWKLLNLPLWQAGARTTEIKKICLGSKTNQIGFQIETCDVVTNAHIHRFAQKLSHLEKSWLAAELSGFLKQMRSHP